MRLSLNLIQIKHSAHIDNRKARGVAIQLYSCMQKVLTSVLVKLDALEPKHVV